MRSVRGFDVIPNIPGNPDDHEHARGCEDAQKILEKALYKQEVKTKANKLLPRVW